MRGFEHLATRRRGINAQIRVQTVLSRNARQHFSLVPFLLGDVNGAVGWVHEDTWMTIEQPQGQVTLTYAIEQEFGHLCVRRSTGLGPEDKSTKRTRH